MEWNGLELGPLTLNWLGDEKRRWSSSSMQGENEMRGREKKNGVERWVSYGQVRLFWEKANLTQF